MRVLVVEDDRMIAKGLHTALKQDGYAVDGVSDGRSAAAALRSSRFDWCCSISACRSATASRYCASCVRAAMRRRSSSSPRATMCENRIAGTRRGRGRLHRQAVRSRRGRGAHALGAAPGGRTRRPVHPSSRHHARSGHRTRSSAMASRCVLSAHEFAVLEALLQRPGAVLSRAQLEDRLYGWSEGIESNAVEVYVHGLRRKLGNDAIRTLRGVGYFVPKELMISIRARLLMALLAVVIVTSLLAGHPHLSARARGDLDLVRLSAAADGAVAAQPDPDGAASRAAPDQADSDFVIQIWDLYGTRVYFSRPGLPLINATALGYADVRVAGGSWRTYGLQTLDGVIQIAQPLRVREALCARRGAARGDTAPAAVAAPRRGDRRRGRQRAAAAAPCRRAKCSSATCTAWRPSATERFASRGRAPGRRAQSAAAAAARGLSGAASLRGRCGA